MDSTPAHPSSKRAPGLDRGAWWTLSEALRKGAQELWSAEERVDARQETAQESKSASRRYEELLDIAGRYDVMKSCAASLGCEVYVRAAARPEPGPFLFVGSNEKRALTFEQALRAALSKSLEGEIRSALRPAAEALAVASLLRL
jgi:hypothetical protein